jgi:hypothetical protein
MPVCIVHSASCLVLPQAVLCRVWVLYSKAVMIATFVSTVPRSLYAVQLPYIVMYSLRLLLSSVGRFRLQSDVAMAQHSHRARNIFIAWHTGQLCHNC